MRPRWYISCTRCGKPIANKMRHKVTMSTEIMTHKHNAFTGETARYKDFKSEGVAYLCDDCYEQVRMVVKGDRNG